jgi:hypothetical protein
MRRLFELQPGQPATMQQRPGRTVVMMAVAQQEAGQLLASLAQRAHRRQIRLHEIADRLMSLIWNPDRSQFTGPVQLGEVDRIPSVGLDQITGLARDHLAASAFKAAGVFAILPYSRTSCWASRKAMRRIRSGGLDRERAARVGAGVQTRHADLRRRFHRASLHVYRSPD